MGIAYISDRMNFFNPYQDSVMLNAPPFAFDTYQPLFNYSFDLDYSNFPLFKKSSSSLFDFDLFNPMTSVVNQYDDNIFGVLLNRPSLDFQKMPSVSAPKMTSEFSTVSSPTLISEPFVTSTKPSKQKKNIFKTSRNTSYAPLNLSRKQLTAYGFDTREKQDAFRHLTPEMQHAVVKLTDYAKSQGIKITYKSKRSIFRTYAEQVQIYKTSRPGYAAKPGYSRHESGEAVDISIPGANANNKNDPKYKKLAAYWQSLGYTWGGKWRHCEPWHFDLRRA